MPKKKIAVLIFIVLALIIAVPILGVTVRKSGNNDETDTMQSMVLWQIDGFEGGKGSRKQFLQSKVSAYFKNQRTYVNVVTLSADAARQNIANGSLPDMISYPACFYGIETQVNAKDFFYVNWCRGGYCLLSIDTAADFTDVTAENTVINSGKDNLVSVTATLCGLGDAVQEPPTNAYLKLISGKYKYLLGTQRDAYRLNTRNLAFVLKPITQFNDLYQNISIITKDASKYQKCKEFVNFLTADDNGVGKLGLFYKDNECDLSELNEMRHCAFEYALSYPCSGSFVNELTAAAQNRDVNKIKNILK